MEQTVLEIILPTNTFGAFGNGIALIYNVLNKLKSNKNYTTVIFDYTNSTYHSPVVFTVLSSISARLVNEGISVYHKIDTASGSFKYYASLIGYPLGFCPENNEVQFDNFNTKTYIPLIKFGTSVTTSVSEIREATLSAINKLIKRQLNIDGNAFHAICHFIDELTNNISDHSKCPFGYLLAQYFPENRYLDLCISDNGQGFLNSYLSSGKYPNVNTEFDAMNAALEGKSTKDQPYSRGFGLSSSRKMLVEGMNGKFFLASDNHCFIYINNKKELYEAPNNVYLAGSFLYLRIPLDIPSDFNYYGFVEG